MLPSAPTNLSATVRSNLMLPFTMPKADQFFSAPRRVLAHYFYPFPLSIDNQPPLIDYYNTQFLTISGEASAHAAYGGYLRARPLPVPVQASFSAQQNMRIEVAAALARGITGFCFDVLSLDDALAPAGHLSNMLAAAITVDPRFWVVPMLDMSSLGVFFTQAQAVELIKSFTHPSFARVADGRLLVAAFNATLLPLAWWQGVITQLNAQGVNVAFLPVLLGSPTSSVLDPIAIGPGAWGTATAAGEAAPAGYLAPVLPQQFRPKDAKYWECGNFDAFRAGWASAIAGPGPLAQVVTWNDYSEGGQLAPSTDATLAPNIGTGFYDLTGYYASWFAMGVPPAIIKDVLYWCHRRMPVGAAHPQQPDAFVAAAGSPPGVDQIECLAFLTAPGILVVNGQAQAAPTGITSLKVPLAPGQPTFALQRNGSNVFSGASPVKVYDASGWPAGTLDLTYWSGSISS
jgi:hypothetical protein